MSGNIFHIPRYVLLAFILYCILFSSFIVASSDVHNSDNSSSLYTAIQPLYDIAHSPFIQTLRSSLGFISYNDNDPYTVNDDISSYIENDVGVAASQLLGTVKSFANNIQYYTNNLSSTVGSLWSQSFGRQSNMNNQNNFSNISFNDSISILKDKLPSILSYTSQQAYIYEIFPFFRPPTKHPVFASPSYVLQLPNELLSIECLPRSIRNDIPSSTTTTTALGLDDRSSSSTISQSRTKLSPNLLRLLMSGLNFETLHHKIEQSTSASASTSSSSSSSSPSSLSSYRDVGIPFIARYTAQFLGSYLLTHNTLHSSLNHDDALSTIMSIAQHTHSEKSFLPVYYALPYTLSDLKRNQNALYQTISISEQSNDDNNNENGTQSYNSNNNNNNNNKRIYINAIPVVPGYLITDGINSSLSSTPSSSSLSSLTVPLSPFSNGNNDDHNTISPQEPSTSSYSPFTSAEYTTYINQGNPIPLVFEISHPLLDDTIQAMAKLGKDAHIGIQYTSIIDIINDIASYTNVMSSPSSSKSTTSSVENDTEEYQDYTQLYAMLSRQIRNILSSSSSSSSLNESTILDELLDHITTSPDNDNNNNNNHKLDKHELSSLLSLISSHHSIIYPLIDSVSHAPTLVIQFNIPSMIVDTISASIDIISTSTTMATTSDVPVILSDKYNDDNNHNIKLNNNTDNNTCTVVSSLSGLDHFRSFSLLSSLSWSKISPISSNVSIASSSDDNNHSSISFPPPVTSLISALKRSSPSSSITTMSVNDNSNTNTNDNTTNISTSLWVSFLSRDTFTSPLHMTIKSANIQQIIPESLYKTQSSSHGTVYSTMSYDTKLKLSDNDDLSLDSDSSMSHLQFRSLYPTANSLQTLTYDDTTTQFNIQQGGNDPDLEVDCGSGKARYATKWTYTINGIVVTKEEYDAVPDGDPTRVKKATSQQRIVCVCPYDVYGIYCEYRALTITNSTVTGAVNPSRPTDGKFHYTQTGWSDYSACNSTNYLSYIDVPESETEFWEHTGLYVPDPTLTGLRPCALIGPESSVEIVYSTTLRWYNRTDINPVMQGIIPIIVEQLNLHGFEWDTTNYDFNYVAYVPADDSPEAQLAYRDNPDAVPPLHAISVIKDEYDPSINPNSPWALRSGLKKSQIVMTLVANPYSFSSILVYSTQLELSKSYNLPSSLNTNNMTIPVTGLNSRDGLYAQIRYVRLQHKDVLNDLANSKTASQQHLEYIHNKYPTLFPKTGPFSIQQQQGQGTKDDPALVTVPIFDYNTEGTTVRVTTTLTPYGPLATNFIASLAPVQLVDLRPSFPPPKRRKLAGWELLLIIGSCIIAGILLLVILHQCLRAREQKKLREAKKDADVSYMNEVFKHHKEDRARDAQQAANNVHISSNM